MVYLTKIVLENDICLSIGSFSSFVSLRELDLSVNGICNMTFDAADFRHLEVYVDYVFVSVLY